MRMAVGGGRTAVGGLPDPLRLIGRPILDEGRWLAMVSEARHRYGYE